MNNENELEKVKTILELTEEEITQPTPTPQILEEQEKILIDFSEQVLKVQQQLNQIEINNVPLEENGFYNEETKQAIIKLQEITDFIPNGIIDQNLIFRLNEIIENTVITDYNTSRTFAVLYHNYRNK